MRPIKTGFILAFTLAAVACGGGDDGTSGDGDGDGDGGSDAGMDAMTGDLGVGDELCDPSTQPPTCTNPPFTACIGVAAGPNMGICTLVCGQTNDTTPPPDGQQTCADNYFQDVGTAACDLIQMGTPNVWACTIACGAGDACPGSLTCRTVNNNKRCLP